jgi:SulP family sulfate permease
MPGLLKNTATIKGDILGGITAGIVSLPLAVAYGVITGLGPAAGIYTALILGLLATLFGGTQAQISGPIGALTIVVSLITLKEVQMAGSLSAALPVLMIIFALTGIIQIMISLLKLGANIRYVPYTVVSGFMSGIGVIIIVLQIPDTLGVYDSPYRTITDIVWHSNELLKQTSWLSLLLSVATLAIIVLAPRWSKRIPGSLIALVVISGATYLLNLDVRKLGIIDFQFTHWSSFDIDRILEFDTLVRIVLASLTMALLGSISTLLTSMVADKMTQTTHRSDRELFGQGLGNLVSGLAGGFPGSGVTATTVTNIQSGGSTKLSGVVCSLFLLSIMLFGMPLAAEIPKPVIDGILIYIGFVLIDRETIKKFKVIPKVDNIVIYTVLILSVFWSLIYAVCIGLIISAIHFMKKMADQVEVDTAKNKVERIVDQLIGSFPDRKEFNQRVMIKTIKGPIFFGFSSRFLHSMKNVPTEVEVVVFNLSFVSYMDYSGVRTLREVIQLLKKRGITICLCEISESNMKQLQAFDIIPMLVDKENLFASVEECVMCQHQSGNLLQEISDATGLYFAPAFTPNFDGINDSWKIRNIHHYPDAHIKVMAKDNQMVFESTGYDRPWNGQINGELLPPGEYQYYITLTRENEELKKNGTVFIFH